jgi:hypothetical protein
MVKQVSQAELVVKEARAQPVQLAQRDLDRRD